MYEKDKKMLPVSVFSDETHVGAPELCHYFVGDHLKCLNYVGLSFRDFYQFGYNLSKMCFTGLTGFYLVSHFIQNTPNQ